MWNETTKDWNGNNFMRREIKTKLIKTAMTERYKVRFAFRIFVFAAVLAGYLQDKEKLYALVSQPIQFGITPLHILWVVFMVTMILHLFPTDKRSMALLKSEEAQYVEVPGYSEVELYRFVQQQNQRAWVVMLVWLCFNAIFGALYLLGVIDSADLLMLTVFYYLCDYEKYQSSI